jgi:hypothetical protein
MAPTSRAYAKVKDFVSHAASDLDNEFADVREKNRHLAAADATPPHGGVAALLASNTALFAVIVLLLAVSAVAFALVARVSLQGRSPRKVLYASARRDYAQLPGAFNLLRDLAGSRLPWSSAASPGRGAAPAPATSCQYHLLCPEEGGSPQPRDAAE